MLHILSEGRLQLPKTHQNTVYCIVCKPHLSKNVNRLREKIITPEFLAHPFSQVQVGAGNV